MSKSMKSRLSKLIAREVYTDDETGERYVISSGWHTKAAPPAHVGKQFPYKNAYRTLIEGVAEDKIYLVDRPHIKEPAQIEREQAYLGRNHHQRDPKQSTGKHGGDGTVLRSSKRKSFRGDQHMAFRLAPNKKIAMGHNFNRDDLAAA